MARVLIGNFKGPKGDSGDKGDRGDGATIQIGEVRSVQPKAPATVQNVGTPTDAILNFEIPRGEDGMTDLIAEYKDFPHHTATPTAAAPVIIKEIAGKTEQAVTTGAQLFDNNNYDLGNLCLLLKNTPEEIYFKNSEVSSGTFVRAIKIMLPKELIKSNYISFSAKLIHTGDITKVGSARVGLYWGKENNLSAKVIATRDVVSSEEDFIFKNIQLSQSDIENSNYDKIVIWIYSQSIATTNVNYESSLRIIKPMLNAGSEPLPWEPYTGGKPSPNPDYPQEIEGVGDSGEVAVVAHGKNSAYDCVYYSSSGFGNCVLCEAELKPSTSYFVSLVIPNGERYYPNEHIFTGDIIEGIGKPTGLIVTTKNNLDKNDQRQCVNGKRWIIFKNCEGSNSSGNAKNLQIEELQEGQTEPTPYQPYTKSKITIPLTSPLYEGDKLCYVKPGESYVDKDGENVVADKLTYGVWRENATEVFDGSEDEDWFEHEPGIGGLVYFSLSNKQFALKEQSSKCDILRNVNNSWNGVEYSTYSDIAYELRLRRCKIFTQPNESVNTTELWKSWLQSNPLTVVYKLATPYFEPFEDQSIFYDLRSTDELTYIYTEDPLNPELVVDVAKNQTGAYLLESYADSIMAADKLETKQDKIITDTATGTKYTFGVENGLAFFEEA